MIVVTTDQRTPEWYAARLGRLTGSAAGDMLAVIKSGEAAARRDLRVRLVCERLTGESQEDVYVSKEMQRGIDKEAAAFSAYEVLTGHVARKAGFVAHDTLAAGCSPDGIVGDCRGLLEVKCPKSATHLRYLRSNKVPTDYLPQIRHNLWITGAQWCDFVSFDDRFPLQLQFLRVRVVSADLDLAGYEAIARAFLAEVDRECEAIATLADVGAVLRTAVSA